LSLNFVMRRKKREEGRGVTGVQEEERMGRQRARIETAVFNFLIVGIPTGCPLREKRQEEFGRKPAGLYSDVKLGIFWGAKAHRRAAALSAVSS